MTTRTRYTLQATCIALGTVGVDQLSKWWVHTRIVPGHPRQVLGSLLRVIYVRNSGAAFGLLAQHRLLLTVIGLLVVGAAVALAPRLARANAPTRYGAALIVGGAVGNAIDRIVSGRVTDFIDVSFFPFVFNLADVSIVVGAGLLLLSQLLGPEDAL